MYPVKVTDCEDRRSVDNIRFQDHWLYGQCTDSFSFCYVLIQVPSGMIVRVHVENQTQPEGLDHVGLRSSRAESTLGLHVFEKKTLYGGTCKAIDLIWYMLRFQTSFYLSFTNRLHLYYTNRPLLKIKFEAVTRKHDVRYTSDLTGFVLPWYHEGFGYVCDQMSAPHGHLIMVSFEWTKCTMAVILFYRNSNNALDRQIFRSSDDDFVIRLFNTTHLDICCYLRGGHFHPKSCFKMYFSFHPENSVPQRLSRHLYNCSVDYYWRFRQHLDCNFKVQCKDGRDETELCAFSSPACQGWVAAQHKCYKLFSLGRRVSAHKARNTCWVRGFQLAAIKTEQEAVAAMPVLRRISEETLIGLTCGLGSKPATYRWIWMWSDKTAVYNANHFKLSSSSYFVIYNTTDRFAYYLHPSTTLSILATMTYTSSAHVVCEKYTEQTEMFFSKSVEFSHESMSPFTFEKAKQKLTTCPRGHLTHAFLSCDQKSRCGRARCYFNKRTRSTGEVTFADEQSVDTVAMYTCSSGDTELSYSLLCDFRQDCADNSDESFCYHPPCTEFTCTNGQCVSLIKRCNKQTDCLDESDEQGCRLTGEQELCFTNKKYQNQNNSFLINFDGRGYFTQRVMNFTDQCPGTHYRCTKEWFYCLPVYTRCNGVFDCIFQEDERDCEGWTCPGLYRCRDSTVCLHADHMCDGWPQCPQRDDEWLCDMICPAQCLCQGHAFRCAEMFPAHLYPELRYLDAGGSGMALLELANNTYIIRLSLAQCSIRVLSDLNFSNLQFLDLSHNKITGFEMNIFTKTENLQILILMRNPLISVTVGPSSLLKNLRKIDLSGTSLDVFGSELLSYTPSIQFINMSFSAKQTIDHRGFQIVPHLKELDIRGTMIDDFSFSLFRGLGNMDIIYTSYYKL